MAPGDHESGGHRGVLSPAERRRFDEIAEVLAPELTTRTAPLDRAGSWVGRTVDRWWVGIAVAVVGVMAATTLARWSIPVAAAATTVAAIGLVHSARRLESHFARRRDAPRRPPGSD